MPVRRAQHEATFADASSATTFDIEARKLGLTKLSFGTLFQYEATVIKDTKELVDMRVTCKIVEAILTEWCRAGQWHNSDRFGDNSDWFGACSHCCLTEVVRGISTNVYFCMSHASRSISMTSKTLSTARHASSIGETHKPYRRGSSTDTGELSSVRNRENITRRR
jgi:hypothetical protein